MAYRVYDNKKKSWVTEKFYLSNNGYECMCKKTFLYKARLLSDRYVVQFDIGLLDKNDKLIFEGDICKSDILCTEGIITYIPAHAAYYLIDIQNNKYYPLYKDGVEESFEVTGNICDNPIYKEETK